MLKFDNIYDIVKKIKIQKDVRKLNRKLIKFTKLMLDVMFYSGLFIVITLPVSLKFLGKHYSVVINNYFYFMLVIFAASGIFGIMIIRQLRKMMKTVIQESCFVYENVKSLNIMATLSLCIAVMFIIKLFVVPTPATAVIVLVFFIAVLFSEVLAHVFAQAVNYKEENDLTI